jgi:hypothetical protein
MSVSFPISTKGYIMKNHFTLSIVVAVAVLFVAACAQHVAPVNTSSTAVNGAAPSLKWDGKSPNLDPSCQGFGC